MNLPHIPSQVVWALFFRSFLLRARWQEWEIGFKLGSIPCFEVNNSTEWHRNALSIYNTFSIWFLTYNYVDTIFVFFFAPFRSNSNVYVCCISIGWRDGYTYITFAGLFIHFAPHIHNRSVHFFSITLILNGFHYAVCVDGIGRERETGIISVVLWINAWWWLWLGVCRQWRIVPNSNTYAVTLVSFRFSRIAVVSLW